MSCRAGYSMCILNARQNSRAGGIETWFFTKNRVLDGDKFRVRGGSEEPCGMLRGLEQLLGTPGRITCGF